MLKYLQENIISMSIRKKMFWMLTCIISVIFLFSYTFIYLLFEKSTENQLIQAQTSAVNTNSLLINNFLDSIRETTLQLIGDEAIGKYLSTSDLTDPIKRLNTRESIINQFSHYSTTQILDNKQGYRNTLFLNDELPISDSFETFTLDSNPYARTCNVFSNKEIAKSAWYKNLQKSKKSTSVFINDSTSEFCFAQKVKNNYYSGPTLSEGLGVMVVSIKLDQLEKSLSFYPITDNSGFALINEDQKILYRNADTLSDGVFVQVIQTVPATKANHTQLLSIETKRYITNVTPLNYGLKILFLTPYSDIRDSVTSMMSLYLVFVCFIIVLTMIVIYLLSRRLTNPLISFSSTVEHIKDTRTFEKSSLNVFKDKELRILSHSFSNLIDRNNCLIDNIQKENEMKKQSELRALQAQINPHFLFNTMDVVNWIALSRNQDDIASIVSSIANMMRYAITDADQMVPLEMELNHIREYVTIYKLRHSSKIQIHVIGEISPKEFQIPKFIIQPLVENSVRHGMKDDTNELNIWIHIFKFDDLYLLELSDDGIGEDCESMNCFLEYQPSDLKVSNGFGIRNVNERIQLNFGGNSGLTYYLKQQHLTARILLDYSQQKS